MTVAVSKIKFYSFNHFSLCNENTWPKQFVQNAAAKPVQPEKQGEQFSVYMEEEGFPKREYHKEDLSSHPHLVYFKKRWQSRQALSR